MPKTLITGAALPDIDAWACALAYADYLNQKTKTQDYVAKFEAKGHLSGQFVADYLGLPYDILQQGDVFEQLILVDASERTGLPKMLDPEKVVEVIDHRMYPHYDYFPKSRFRVEPVGAAATLIAEFFYFDPEVTLDSKLASALLCAMYYSSKVRIPSYPLLCSP
jgi:inorganic pyrophosphatase/exopolyphosphatase